MSVVTLAITGSTSPQGAKSTTAQTIVVESDKFVIFPADTNTTSIVYVNGWKFLVAAEVAELASLMSSLDGSAYT
jgi:hypothetical protein